MLTNDQLALLDRETFLRPSTNLAQHARLDPFCASDRGRRGNRQPLACRVGDEDSGLAVEGVKLS
jgi:hypothetical protein